MKRLLVAFAALAVALGLGLGARELFFGPKPPPKFETVAVERGRIVARVTATGTVSAHVTVQVGSQVSGRIAELLVDFNSEVKKGDLLARIDPELLQANVAQARANHTAALGSVAKAKAQVENAKLQLERATRLSKEGLVSQADLDTARAQARAADAEVLVARGGLEQASAQLKTAEVNVAYTKIVSPVDGVVISRTVDVGQTVAATLQAPTLFTIAENLEQMQIDTNVSEGDVGKLKPGMAATFTVDAYPTEVFQGKVRQIRNAAQTIQNVVTYDAVIDVDNEELKLRPGMTANVTFVYAERDDVLRVPNAALRFRPAPELVASASGSASAHVAQAQRGPGGEGRKGPKEGRGKGQKSVWVLRAGALTKVPVEIGISDGTSSEILGDKLASGDEVVVDVNTGEKKPPPQGGRGMPRM